MATMGIGIQTAASPHIQSGEAVENGLPAHVSFLFLAKSALPAAFLHGSGRVGIASLVAARALADVFRVQVHGAHEAVRHYPGKKLPQHFKDPTEHKRITSSWRDSGNASHSRQHQYSKAGRALHPTSAAGRLYDLLSHKTRNSRENQALYCE